MDAPLPGGRAGAAVVDGRPRHGPVPAATGRILPRGRAETARQRPIGAPGRVSSASVVDLPFASVPLLAPRLAGVMDTEGKIARALEALGPLAGRDVAAVDVPGTGWVDRLRAGGT